MKYSIKLPIFLLPAYNSFVRYILIGMNKIKFLDRKIFMKKKKQQNVQNLYRHIRRRRLVVFVFFWIRYKSSYEWKTGLFLIRFIEWIVTNLRHQSFIKNEINFYFLEKKNPFYSGKFQTKHRHEVGRNPKRTGITSNELRLMTFYICHNIIRREQKHYRKTLWIKLEIAFKKKFQIK